MGNENGFEFTPNEGGIGQPDQKVNPYEPISTGEKMRRSVSQSKFFDNNGGNNKAEAGGVINNNAEYGPITYGF
jgi:hypothetical protein